MGKILLRNKAIETLANRSITELYEVGKLSSFADQGITLQKIRLNNAMRGKLHSISPLL